MIIDLDKMNDLLGRLDSIKSQLNSLMKDSARDKREFKAIKLRLNTYNHKNNRIQEGIRKFSEYRVLETLLSNLSSQIKHLKQEFKEDRTGLDDLKSDLENHAGTLDKLTEKISGLELNKAALDQDFISLISVTEVLKNLEPLDKTTAVFQAIGHLKPSFKETYIKREERKLRVELEFNPVSMRIPEEVFSIEETSMAPLCLEFQSQPVAQVYVNHDFEPVPKKQILREYQQQEVPIELLEVEPEPVPAFSFFRPTRVLDDPFEETGYLKPPSPICRVAGETPDSAPVALPPSAVATAQREACFRHDFVFCPGSLRAALPLKSPGPAGEYSEDLTVQAVYRPLMLPAIPAAIIPPTITIERDPGLCVLVVKPKNTTPLQIETGFVQRLRSGDLCLDNLIAEVEPMDTGFFQSFQPQPRLPYTEEERRYLAYHPRLVREQVQEKIDQALETLVHDYLVPIGNNTRGKAGEWSRETVSHGKRCSSYMRDRMRWVARNPRYLALFLASIVWIFEPNVIAHTTIQYQSTPVHRGTIASLYRPETRVLEKTEPEPAENADMTGTGLHPVFFCLEQIETLRDRLSGLCRDGFRIVSSLAENQRQALNPGKDKIAQPVARLPQKKIEDRPSLEKTTDKTPQELISGGRALINPVSASGNGTGENSTRIIYIAGFKNPRNRIFSKNVKVTHDGHLIHINGVPHVIHWAAPIGKSKPEELVEPLEDIIKKRNFSLTALTAIYISNEQYALYQREIARILSGKSMPKKLSRNLRKNLCHRFTYGLVSKRYNPRFEKYTIWIPQCDAPVAFKQWHKGWGNNDPSFNRSKLLINPFRKKPSREQMNNVLLTAGTHQGYAVVHAKTAGKQL